MLACLSAFSSRSNEARDVTCRPNVKLLDPLFRVVYSLHKRIWVKFHPQFTHKTQR